MKKPISLLLCRSFHNQSRQFMFTRNNSFLCKGLTFSSCLRFNFSSETGNTQEQTLSLERYLHETHHIFEFIYETLDSKDLDEIDSIDLTEGVLNIKFKPNRSYVLNIQRPNLQIWLSSPFSGPQRFEFDLNDSLWKNIRNKRNLLAILNEEFNEILKENNKQIKLL